MSGSVQPTGIIGNLFGQPGTVSASGSVQLPDWVNQAALQNYNTAMALSQQPYTPYPGQIVAPLSADQTQAFSAIQGLQGGTQPAFGQALGNVQNLPSTTQSLLNPYLGSVESDTVSNIQRASALQGQQIAAQAQQAGAYGGSRYGVAQATLDSETQRNIGQAINQIQSQGWNTASNLALQQAQEEAGLATGGQTAALQQAGALANVGGAQQEEQQAQLSSALAQWQQQQNWPYSQLAIAQGALAGSPYGTTSTSSQPYSNPTLQNALATAGALIPQIGGAVQGATNLYNNLFGTPTSQTATGAPLTLGDAQTSFPALTGGGTSNTGNFGTFTGSVPSYGSYGFGALSGATNTASNVASDTSGDLSFLADSSAVGW